MPLCAMIAFAAIGILAMVRALHRYAGDGR